MNEQTQKPNRLINETSPYLLQHAYNPVDWYPWNDQALEFAKNTNRLILLSIGYSACHWCHVMEQESFTDLETAELMNKHFVCIKVDREERPDIDKVYQTAHQLFNQRGGGWPLTAFLTPDEHTPVFVGTYFPNTARAGMPSFSTVLKNLSESYKQKKFNLVDHNRAVKEAFSRLQSMPSDNAKLLNKDLVMDAIRELRLQYDPVYGGFGDAPKFPHPTQLTMLLASWQRPETESKAARHAVDMAVHTLESMARSGLYDHLAGGFYRYSVDAKWEIPHFEKMLYDNAQLLPIYADASLITGREEFKKIAIVTSDWVIREMQSENGGYYSTIDADSEHEEGKFYVWDLTELEKLLSPDELQVVEVRFGLRGVANFEGKWHLRVVNPLPVVADRYSMTLVQVDALLLSACKKMLAARIKRVPPGLDDKILTSWNGLMIKAMARAGRLLGEPKLIESAERALCFIRKQLWQNGRLLVSARGSKSHLNGYLDDYVFLAEGLIELLQARWSDEDFKLAMKLMDIVLDYFQDPNSGAFFFTSDDHEQLIYRSIPTNDEATPSGNGVAAQVLLKLAYLSGEQKYYDVAAAMLSTLQPTVSRMPSAFSTILMAIEDVLNPNPTLVIHGKPDDIKEWAAASTAVASQNLVVFPISLEAKELPGFLKSVRSNPETRAYLCDGFTCSLPFSSLDELLEKLPRRKTRQKLIQDY